MNFTIAKQTVRVMPAMAKGKGGEADIYELPGGRALKVFKAPDHPDYEGQPAEQEGARARLAEHQQKLPAFPQSLPATVVTPVDLAYRGSQIAGYTMPFFDQAETFLRLSDRAFRAGYDTNRVLGLFRQLHAAVVATHDRGVVLGDFNDLNVLFRGSDVRIIDADSMQFGPYLCRVFTDRFVDPVLCDPQASSPRLARPHTADSDWYAMAVMLFQSLLFVHPYGGVYKPVKGPRVKHPARPLHRISVFHKEVIYPKPAVPYDRLPDDLLHFYQGLLHKDVRGAMPGKLLDVVWTKCLTCGTEHGRGTCPVCHKGAPAAVKESLRIKGTVTATRVYRTSGRILFATVQDGQLLYVTHENGKVLREDQSLVMLAAQMQSGMRFRIRRRETVVALGESAVILPRSERLAVSQNGTVPLVDANAHRVIWLQGDQLRCDDVHASRVFGEVIGGQTWFWVGEKFGFGFYRAGNLQVSFLFDAQNPRAINDSVKLPVIRGQLVDAHVVCDAFGVWVFLQTRAGGATINHCHRVTVTGQVEASAQAPAGDGSWLGEMRGKTHLAKMLFAATDEGLVRVETQAGQIVVTREYPDTEPFVNAGQRLFLTADGLWVVGDQEITKVVMK